MTNPQISNVGATTPLSPEVLEIMVRLGPRLLNYDADRRRKRTDELVEYVRRGNNTGRMQACREAVHKFLRRFYRQHPPGSVSTNGITIPDAQVRLLALWADTLTRLRAKLDLADEDPGAVEPIEHAERVLGMLKNFALGSALVHGRSQLHNYDLAQVGHIALSSGIEGRGKALRALIRLGGRATRSQIEEKARVSRPTALRYMKELDAVGLAWTEKKDGETATELRKHFVELCNAPRLRKPKRGEGKAVQRKAKRGEGGKPRA